MVGLATAVMGCQGGEAAPEQVILASTTSTEDSGLFDLLIPAFEAKHARYDVVVIAAGTGEALELGRRKDADILLVHAPAAESAFVAGGYGTERSDVMSNDFVIVGAPADPARVRGLGDPAEALRRIAAVGAGSGAAFVSRGDDSGTHRKERELWSAAGIRSVGSWYLDAGLGMGEVLRIASERAGYTLTDRATFLYLQDNLALEVLVEGDDRLFNQYGVIPVAGARNPAGAEAFRDWLTSEPAQRLIGRYGTDRFGQPLFRPNAREPAD